MDNTHEIVSVFLDDEPFNPDELAHALSDPAGRALLIDLVALRHLSQPQEITAASAAGKGSSLRRGILAIAALLVALVGGYVLGARQTETAPAAPVPTRVIQTQAVWQDVPVERPQ